MKSRSYVQFSKRMVQAVMVCVHAIMIICIAVMAAMGDLSAMAEVMRHYLAFAGVVFVAYCGNSAIEKAALAWAGRRSAVTEEDAANG